MINDDEKRISLHVLGLSCSQLQSGAYALVLAEDNGPRRIPVIIGEGEAQSIAIALEGIRTARPLTHDLFVSFAHAYGVRLKEVFITRFADGIFYSQLTFCDNDGRYVTMDARTSDAVAIAMRTGTPIYTTEEIVRTAGFVIDDNMVRPASETEAENDSYDSDTAGDDDDGEFGAFEPEGSDEAYQHRSRGYHDNPRPENFTIEQLERTLAELIEKEDYEEADRINRILKRKRGEDPDTPDTAN